MTQYTPVIKTELHAHTALDPLDYIAHSTRDLIDRAAGLGYGALAVTLHNRYYDPVEDAAYAKARGVVMIAGVERTIDGRHLLLLNYPAACAEVASFDELRALRQRHPDGLVVAPHAFYPIGSSLGSLAERHRDVIDAVEVNSMFTRWLDFNAPAVAWARRHGKPLVGNTDLHLLDQLGTTYTLVDATPDATAICAAVRAGRVQVRSNALSSIRAAWIFARMSVAGLIGRLRALRPSGPAGPSQ